MFSTVEKRHNQSLLLLQRTTPLHPIYRIALWTVQTLQLHQAQQPSIGKSQHGARAPPYVTEAYRQEMFYVTVLWMEGEAIARLATKLRNILLRSVQLCDYYTWLHPVAE